jgi:hypothetical protein
MFDSGTIWRYYLFPNRTVPITQVTSRGIGWPSGTEDEWVLEFQVYFADLASRFITRYNADADADLNYPDNYLGIRIEPSLGKFTVFHDDKQGTTLNTGVNISLKKCQFHHFAIQKASGGQTLRIYFDGNLVFNQSVPSAPTTMDYRYFVADSGPVILREYVVRASNPYPTVPFTPGGPVEFASAIGDTQRRWNSFMLSN